MSDWAWCLEEESEEGWHGKFPSCEAAMSDAVTTITQRYIDLGLDSPATYIVHLGQCEQIPFPEPDLWDYDGEFEESMEGTQEKVEAIKEELEEVAKIALKKELEKRGIWNDEDQWTVNGTVAIYKVNVEKSGKDGCTFSMYQEDKRTV